MKLRIRRNSLRLRLTRSEVAEIGVGGVVEEIIEFGSEPGQQLVYTLVTSNDFQNLTATFDSGCITIFIPKSQASEWARTNQIGLEAIKPIGGGDSLQISIEKHFTSLEPREGDENNDTFSHPL